MNRSLLWLLLVALVIGAGVSLLASSRPDVLERFLGQHGKQAPGDLAPGDLAPGDLAPGDLAPGDLAPGEKDAEEATGVGPFPDYQVPGIGSELGGRALAGLIGTVVTFLVLLGVTKLLRRRAPAPAPRPRAGEGQ